MTTYVLPPGTVPYGATSRECTLPEENKTKFKVCVSLQAKPITSRAWNMTAYRGDTVPENITSLEQLVTKTSRHPEYWSNFDTMAKDFNKIECIKAVRSVTGWGLKAAKEFMEEVGRLGGDITIIDFQKWETVNKPNPW